MLRSAVGCIIVACSTWSLSTPSSASEDAILDALRSGAVKLGAEVPVPPAADAAPSLGGEPSVNPLVNVTKEEERLIVDKLFPLAMAKWPFNLAFVCWENP